MPALLTKHGYPIFKYSAYSSLSQWIETAAVAAGK